MTPATEQHQHATASGAPRVPSAAVWLATGFGLGRLPRAPGTYGSALGVALVVVLWMALGVPIAEFNLYLVAACAVVALAGVWASSHAVAHFQKKDPQQVVIDEISGQMIAFLGVTALNWQYLLAGFILFRALDIWKPFPARRMESLPGGWGVMADDWAAGIYAALILWAARAAGFLVS